MKLNDMSDLMWTDASRAILAGAAGGLVRWITLRDNWREGVPAVIAGALSALYLGPLAVPLLEPWVGPIAPGENAEGFSSFVVGIAGISLTGLVIDIFAKIRKGGGNAQNR